MIYLRRTEVEPKVLPDLVESVHRKHHWKKDQWQSWTQFNNAIRMLIIALITLCKCNSRSAGTIPKCSRQHSVQSQSPSMPYFPLLISPDISIVVQPKPMAQLKVGSTRSSQASWSGRSNVVGSLVKQAKTLDLLPINTDGGKDAVSVQSRDNRMFW